MKRTTDTDKLLAEHRADPSAAVRGRARSSRLVPSADLLPAVVRIRPKVRKTAQGLELASALRFREGSRSRPDRHTLDHASTLAPKKHRSELRAGHAMVFTCRLDSGASSCHCLGLGGRGTKGANRQDQNMAPGPRLSLGNASCSRVSQFWFPTHCAI